MKGLIIFLMGIICCSNERVTVDESPINTLIDTPAVIKKIQSDFSSINKQLNFLKKRRRDAFGMSSEGGELIGYYDKGTLKKIHCVFYGETGKAESDYYFNSKGLFFSYKKEMFYDKPMYLKDSKIKNSTETRSYLFGNKVIKQIIKPDNHSVLSYNKIKEELIAVMNILNEK